MGLKSHNGTKVAYVPTRHMLDLNQLSRQVVTEQTAFVSIKMSRSKKFLGLLDDSGNETRLKDEFELE